MEHTLEALQNLTLACSECLLSVRLGRYLNRPELNRDTIRYCPMCKGNAVVKVDSKEDFWDGLANSYGISVEAIQAIYSAWIPEETPKFKDHLEQMIREVLGSINNEGNAK